MELDAENSFLYITHQKGIFGPERTIKLELGVGCAGIAFKEQKMVSADLSKHDHKEFGLNDDAINKIPTTMKSIISVPLVDFSDPANAEVKGVLSFTTTLAFEKSGFGKSEIQERILAFSDTLSKILFS